MTIINKQCGYYVYLLIFEARAFFSGKVFSCTRTVISRACIGAEGDLFSRESFSMRKRRQQTMLSFLSTAEKSRRQTGNNSLGIRVNKYNMLF